MLVASATSTGAAEAADRTFSRVEHVLHRGFFNRVFDEVHSSLAEDLPFVGRYLFPEAGATERTRQNENSDPVLHFFFPLAAAGFPPPSNVLMWFS